MKKWTAVAAVLLAVILVYTCGMMLLENVNEQTYTVRVVDKLRVTYGHVWLTHKYLIFTIDDNDVVRVFENTDSTPRGKYNSSDYYARIRVGDTYTFKTVGFRLPFFSIYKNIIGIEQEEAT